MHLMLPSFRKSIELSGCHKTITWLHRQMLYNDCWHRFLVRSWWTRVFGQAVTLWLVNRGWQNVGLALSSRCLTGRRPRDMRTTRSDLDSQSSQNRESSQGYAAEQRRHGLQGGASVGTRWLQEEDMGQEEVPSLSICLSIYRSNLQKN